MIRRLLRVFGFGEPEVPCWCGRFHRAGYWHDPTHGRIDRDIQEHARELLGIPLGASVLAMQASGHSVSALAACEENMQRRRDRGLGLYWDTDASRQR